MQNGIRAPHCPTQGVRPHESAEKRIFSPGAPQMALKTPSKARGLGLTKLAPWAST